MKLEDVDYDKLVHFLRNWRSLAGEQQYDFVGMFHLFRACLLNLMEYSNEEDWLAVQELLEPSEREFLTQLAKQTTDLGNGESSTDP